MAFWQKTPEEQLVKAVRKGSPDVVARLLNAHDQGLAVRASALAPDLLAQTLRSDSKTIFDLLIDTGIAENDALMKQALQAGLNRYGALGSLYCRKTVDLCLHVIDRCPSNDFTGKNGGNMLHLLSGKARNVDGYGWIEEGHLLLAKAFLRKNPDLIHAQDAMGMTPLHHALSGHRHSEAINLIKILIKAGADPHVKNLKGFSPLDLAYRQSWDNVIDMMKNADQLSAPALAATSEQTNSSWKKVADDKVAHVETFTDLNYKLTSIFNFTARERVSISQNLETKIESLQTVGFDDIADKTCLEQAHGIYQAQGGTIGKDSIYPRHISKSKNSLNG